MHPESMPGQALKIVDTAPDGEFTQLNPEIFRVLPYSRVDRSTYLTFLAFAIIQTRGCVWELWLGLLVDKWERVVYDIPCSGVNREAQE